MGFFDRFRRQAPQIQVSTASENVGRKMVVVGADKETDIAPIQSFDNSNITFNGELSSYDYGSILRNKQDNIVKLFELSDYYADADPIIHGIIYHVFVPFCTCSDWYLNNTTDKTAKKYYKYYSEQLHLREKLDDIFTQLAKYNNCYCYLLNGNLITLPVHKIKISNTTLSGEPILEFDVASIVSEFKTKYMSVGQEKIKDGELDYVLKGYPPEVAKSIKEGKTYAQLDPQNTFTLQGPKEGWVRYALPFTTAALSSLARKELIKEYETAMLNLKRRSFVHVTYGDEKRGLDTLPNREELIAVRNLFKSGMQGFPLVVTNALAKAAVVTPDIDDLYQWPIYSTVNQDILSAGGISGILVTGTSDEGSTFSTAQVSMQTAETRINNMREAFCDMMNRINKRLVEYVPGTYNLKEIPQFHFKPLDMAGKKALREACGDLWEKGVISTKTFLDTNGYSIDIEKAQREKEFRDGTDKAFVGRNQKTVGGGDGAGRPELDNEDKSSNPDNSASGKQPKPSNPEGSNTE